MTWFLTCAAVLWILSWILFVARVTASRGGEEQVEVFRIALPVFCVTTLLSAFAFMHDRGPIFKVVLWVHHAAIFFLFIFLSAAELFQAQVWWQIKKDVPTESIAATMYKMWLLVEILPAGVALTILLTGLRMIWESPANSPGTFWLLALILSFSIFFFDGILGYQPIVRRMRKYWVSASKQKCSSKLAASAWHSTVDQLQLLAHFLSWPFVFMLGVFRWNPPNPLSPLVFRLERLFATLPAGWPGVITALILWGATGIVVAILRALARALRRDDPLTEFVSI